MRSLLIIGFVWPEPKSSAAGGRMMSLISLFQEQGFQVIFASPAQDSDFMIELDEYNVEKKSILLNSETFDTYITTINPEIVLFDRFMIEEQFGWRVAENCPDALRILDTEDLHCLRLSRQKAFKENRKFKEEDLLEEEAAKREVASILRCDLTLMISSYEIELLTKLFKIDHSLLYYLPLILKDNAIAPLETLPPFKDRTDFIFIGNFLHEPNWNTVQYLKETIWPLIKSKLPDARLNIYGAYPTQKVLQLNNPKTGFLIKGRAEDANIVVQNSRVVLAPIRFGAGIKGKLMEAMLNGTPSITTYIGAESMHGDLPWNGFITDNPETFAEQAVALYSDEKVWSKAQLKGTTLLKERYRKNIFKNDFKNTVDQLLANIKQHRTNNFMGQLLQHHSLKSTKYMAKWIEEKNKH
ncbi:glycosyltransferase [Flavobacterium frigidarium]|uniref:glycosyltransferase n=1 Tax=Flavobacterium frigidarium TaxID=99286 RepID=UPI00041DC23B|nr:glycosyltransferase [Flavobacterium frigidarium]